MNRMKSGVGSENVSTVVGFKPTNCQWNTSEMDYCCVLRSQIYASQMHLGDL